MTALRSGPVGAQLWQRTLDLIFPPSCVGCADFGALLCETCEAMMSPADGPRCDVCWSAHPGPSEAEDCHRCRIGRPAFEEVRAAFVYEGVTRETVLALKFKGFSSLAPLMSDDLAERFTTWGPPVDTIVPVPLSPARKRQRGFDQADLLARDLARIVGIEYEPHALTRRRTTPPQTQQPDAEARRRNVAGAFGPGRRRILGRVLLVDDVVTTGATLDACARVLLNEGADAVYAMTYARED